MLKRIYALFLASVLFAGAFLFCGNTFYGSAAKREQIYKRSEFLTYFDGENLNRAHNISLAARAINGKEVGAGEEFSFNAAVGERSEERGYREAKVISGGEYTLGVGGGVCQVSTTLYNAVLLAGLEATEVYAHTLPVSYVEPSFDAMVSRESDFRFKNITSSAIFIYAKAEGGCIKISVYGEENALEISRESRVIALTPLPEEKIVEGCCEKVIYGGKRGIISEGYLIVGDKKTSREIKLRRDYYRGIAPVREIAKENGG